MFQNDIWNSADGITWNQVGQAEWTPRGAHTVVAFKGKLWLLGGADHVKEDRGTDRFLNDVWTSDDGLKWTQASAAAGWAPRDYPRVVVYHDELYLLGGQGHADIWSSADGASWTAVSPEADWKRRFDYGAHVFDGKLWVFGGRTGDPKTTALNDIWFSSNGRDWSRQTDHAPWGPRSGGHSIVYGGKLWIFSGKHTGAADSWGGDIWTMSPKGPNEQP